MRVECDAIKRAVSVKLRQSIQFQPDLEWPQIDVFQRNWLGYERERVSFLVKIHFAEFMLELLKVFNKEG